LVLIRHLYWYLVPAGAAVGAAPGAGAGAGLAQLAATRLKISSNASETNNILFLTDLPPSV
jgi:hypothetical protein